jgi:hypothetical protein
VESGVGGLPWVVHLLFTVTRLNCALKRCHQRKKGDIKLRCEFNKKKKVLQSNVSLLLQLKPFLSIYKWNLKVRVKENFNFTFCLLFPRLSALFTLYAFHRFPQTEKSVCV